MTRIAVTGGSGKAGRAIVRDLLEHGHEVLNIDRVPSPGSDSPDSPAPFLRADLTDFGQALEALNGGETLPGIEAVVHLAAIPSPAHATPDQVFRTNVTSTHTVFAAAVRASARLRAGRRGAPLPGIQLRVVEGAGGGDGATVQPAQRPADRRAQVLQHHGASGLPALPVVLERSAAEEVEPLGLCRRESRCRERAARPAGGHPRG